MQNILIEKLLAEHRAKAFIACDENCFCWTIERVLVAQDAAQQAETDDCPSCAGSGKKEIGGMLLTCLVCDGTGTRR